MTPHCRALDAVSTGYCGARRGDRLEAVDDLARVPRVVGEVEDLVEVEAEVARRQEVAQRGGGVPRALGVLLHDAVRLVALHPAGDEGEQDALGEQRSVG